MDFDLLFDNKTGYKKASQPIRSFHKMNNKNIPNESESNDNKNQEKGTHKPSTSKPSKASIMSVYRYLRPYMKKDNTMKLLIFSVLLTVASKGLISLVK